MTPYEDAFQFWRRNYLLSALEASNGMQTKAAKLVGLHRNTMGKFLRKAGIDSERIKRMIRETK